MKQLISVLIRSGISFSQHATLNVEDLLYSSCFSVKRSILNCFFLFSWYNDCESPLRCFDDFMITHSAPGILNKGLFIISFCCLLRPGPGVNLGSFFVFIYIIFSLTTRLLRPPPKLLAIAWCLNKAYPSKAIIRLTSHFTATDHYALQFIGGRLFP